MIVMGRSIRYNMHPHIFLEEEPLLVLFSQSQRVLEAKYEDKSPETPEKQSSLSHKLLYKYK